MFQSYKSNLNSNFSDNINSNIIAKVIYNNSCNINYINTHKLYFNL